MRWKTEESQQCFRVARSVDIDAPVERVYSRWIRYEDFPRLMQSVRRTKRIDERCVLWDLDIGGHQILWEAHIVENVPGERIRWDSRWGALNHGEVRFEALSGGRTRLVIEIHYSTRSWLEWLGARLSLVDAELSRDLARFRQHVEGLPPDEPPSGVAPARARARPRAWSRAAG